ncbi:MAG: histidinol dehydrogenase [Candidatus Mycalebacterium zealandia]|nr:MAG: histidinol dehydrogenase [Candidatus Mycalebacterium zealandia]
MKITNVNSANIKKQTDAARRNASNFDSKTVANVSAIVERVRKGGDSALFSLTKKFDGASISAKTVEVSHSEAVAAVKKVSKSVIRDLKLARSRIERYQKQKLPRPGAMKDALGNRLGWITRPLERVGIYIPGGKAAYPSTVLMTAVPAKVAGVSEIVMATPCPGGELNPEAIAAAQIAGVDRIFKIGGAQAVAALAFGTRSVPRVDKIAGPGNIYVTIAKKLVYGEVDIDMMAGPSEVFIIADGSCPPEWVASDLLAQSEHDEMAVPVLAATSRAYAVKVKKALLEMAQGIERKKIAGASIRNNGKIFVVSTLRQAVALANAMGPEHLQICVKNPRALLPLVRHAGAIFLGSLSTEAFGDYICGSSHVLPTGGARFSSPLSAADFVKTPSVAEMSARGFEKLSGAVVNLARAEGLTAHALSVTTRTATTRKRTKK